jgi:CubicO group peptidase (beta-lactamase class C family)
MNFTPRTARVLFLLSVIAAQAEAATPLAVANCARAAQYSESKRGSSVLVMQDGRVIFERYSNGGAANGAWPIFSGTKSFWGIAALIAVGEGLFQLDDRVADTITEWQGDPQKSQITIRQLLNFTDGLDPAPHLHRDSIRDRNAMALQLSVVASPGSKFIYGPSHLQVFSEVLRRKLNGRSTVSYLEDRVLRPLGIGSMDYKKDGRGNPLPATGFHLSARQWAAFGEMVLGRGNYRGRQIVSGGLLQQAFNGSAANPSYGLTFWLNRPARFFARENDMEKELDLPWQRASWRNTCICKGAPPDMIVALGSGYHRLFIIPSLNAVIVRQSSSGNEKFSDAQFLRMALGR